MSNDNNSQIISLKSYVEQRHKRDYGFCEAYFDLFTGKEFFELFLVTKEEAAKKLNIIVAYMRNCLNEGLFSNKPELARELAFLVVLSKK